LAASRGPTYSIGIDLGTTNSALAFREMEEGSGVGVASIPQLTNINEVTAEKLLPSFLYMPGEKEFPKEATALPWKSDSSFIVGRFAQRRGAEVSSRLVSSAKSWLSYSAIDRSAATLPWKAADGVTRISPVEASAAYLRHLRTAWEHEHPDAAFAKQEVLVTIPASFDAVARELTEKAAEIAGFSNVTMLEEPQAAFYAWIERHDDWRQRIGKGDLVLVVDIGGGTTDFTLISVSEHDGQLQLDRVAVGDHILLGGDNIDLALAHTVAAELGAKGTRIDSFQLQALWNNCRLAKEKLLDPVSPASEVPVTILGKGSSLIGGTIKATLRREQVEQVLEGFFPRVASTDAPQKARPSGLQEMGLPYAADAAVTGHLARFLRQGQDKMACPTHVLFNGGVLHAPFVRERLLSVLNEWLRDEGAAAIQPLAGEDLMHAVARGAAYYGAARHGKGVRIRGGIPRSYYVGIESAMPAVPGIAAPVKAFAVAQYGMEEGSSVQMPNREFGLTVGETAEFRFFSSTDRRMDAPGTLIDDFGQELEELSPVSVRLESSDPAGTMVAVSLETVITETGTLQLWCVARDGRRWKLEFNVREK
jgi:molecular chaperone DnaK (HSP70)